MDEDIAKVVSREDAKSPEDLLATGGGNAPAIGVTFQGAVGALFAVAALLGRPIDSRLGLGAVQVRGLRFETEAPLDDIIVPTSADGHVFIQAKASLTLSWPYAEIRVTD